MGEVGRRHLLSWISADWDRQSYYDMQLVEPISCHKERQGLIAITQMEAFRLIIGWRQLSYEKRTRIISIYTPKM